MDTEEQGSKSPLASKTIRFNVGSGILLHAVWPFLPRDFRSQPYAMSAVTAWLTIGNVVLRFFTSEALSLFARKANEKPEDPAG